MRRQITTWRTLSALTVSVLVGMPVFVVHGQQPRQDIEFTLTKQAKQGDPGLWIRSASGNSRLGRVLRRVVSFSGWFEVVDGESGNAAYVVDASYEGSSGSGELTLTVGAPDGRRFRLRSNGGSVETLCRMAVDRLIREVFDQTGPCMSAIAFVSGQRLKDVSAMFPDGTGGRRLTRDGMMATEPNWGGKAGQLVYTLYRDHHSETVLLDVVNRRKRRLAVQQGLNSGAALSPDGTLLAVCRSKHGRVDLVVQSLAGDSTRPLTSDEAVEASPAWSPDGSRLCFVSDRGGIPRVYTSSRTGGGQRCVLPTAAESVSPDWSPDGRRIVFALRRGGRFRLAYVDADNPAASAPVVFTDSSSDWQSPSWGPDSRHVVCVRENGVQRSLCIVDSRDGSVHPLTRRGSYSLPDWSGRLQLW